MHEYTVMGHPREKLILYISLISFAISNFLTYLTQVWFKDHFNIVLTISLSSITIFTLVYLLFNHYVWKLNLFGRVFRFPNLKGEWECIGASNNAVTGIEHNWEGSICIEQTWDKILISIKTKNSASQSLSLTGGIRYYPGVGYKVSYHYENIPTATEKELKKHDGFCILTFNENMLTAEGCYYNNSKDRATYGEMKLKRRHN